MFKNIWFQIHWFIGITAGTILMAIGLTGGILAFREEIMDALNPGVMHVAVHQAQADLQALTPQQLLDRIAAAEPGRRVTSMSITAEAGASARVVFAPPLANAAARRAMPTPIPVKSSAPSPASHSSSWSNASTAGCCCRWKSARSCWARWPWCC